MALFGSYGRASGGVGSVLDLLLIDARASGSQQQRLLCWQLELLPLSCDAVVLTLAEHEALLGAGSRFATELHRDTRWVWCRQPSDPHP